MIEIIEALSSFIATNPDSELMKYAETGLSALIIFYLRRISKSSKKTLEAIEVIQKQVTTNRRDIKKLKKVENA